MLPLEAWVFGWLHISTRMPILKGSGELLGYEKFVPKTRRGSKPCLPDLGTEGIIFLRFLQIFSVLESEALNG